MRHTVKPLAYLRYGDDFVVFCRDKSTTFTTSMNAGIWLKNNLSLQLHKGNNVIIPAAKGLKFLGHRICMNSVTIDKNNARKLAQATNKEALLRYNAMHLSPKQRKLLLWQSLNH